MSEFKDNVLAGIHGLRPPTVESRQAPNALGQQEFFDLMVAQLQNQDPLNPTDSAEFLSQVAQFSTVNGINQMQQSIATLAEAMTSSQALQASMLVGGDVLVSSRAGFLESGKSMEGAIELPAATGQVMAQIFTPSGQLVRELELGPQDSGLVRFAWDGNDASGEFAPPGAYVVQASAVRDGQNEALETFVVSHVDSVTLDARGADVTLNLRGLGPVKIADVRAIL
jgi:flagellar basal-body rod modification protein FlgD